MDNNTHPPDRGWIEKFRVAFRGVKIGVRGQSSFFAHFFIAAAVIGAGVVLRVNLGEWCILLLCMAVVLAAEMFNTALESMARAITRQVPGGGTTLTAALILGNQMTIAHVGDSRAYLINENGNIESLTRDHSLVKRLVELGQITTDEAAVHPQRNVLYRALGQGEPFDPDINSLQTPEGGSLLLCSDGLWGVVPEETIQRLVRETQRPEEACHNLIEAANDAGGPDNISAIIIRLPG